MTGPRDSRFAPEYFFFNPAEEEVEYHLTYVVNVFKWLPML